MRLLWLIVFLQLLSTAARPHGSKKQKLGAQPTPDQLAWLDQSDIGFLIHYNIASYLPVEYDGCNRNASLVPDISLFAPSLLDTDNWVKTFQDVGANYAMLVVKHCCGFTTWPTQVQFRLTTNETIRYNYSIQYSPKSETDLLQDFVASCRKAGIRTGVYYSVLWNN
jgi:alpha-L-fucosidase